MAAITAAQVKTLREETGLPLMECKSALTEAGGDTAQAKEILQKKYKGKMESRSANVTGEGRIAIFISEDRKSASIADVRCETAPVAKTDRFVELADTVARSCAKQDIHQAEGDAIKELPSVDHEGWTLGEELTDAFGVIRENIRFERVRRVSGAYVCGYVHHDGKTGVVVALDAVPNPESVGTDLCHHVAFANPMAIRREELPAEELDRVRKLAREVAEGEGKPDHIVDKIADGKVNAFCAENALMDQEHVKVSKTTVRDVLRSAGVNEVVDFAYFKIGG